MFGIHKRSNNSLGVREAVLGRGRPKRLFREEAGLRVDIGGRAQRENNLSLNSLGVREAVSGRGRPRGCFGEEPA